MPERNPFSSAADLRSPPPPIPPSCPVHGDAASLWCRDGAIVCSRCVIFGDHKGHDVLETVENSTCRRLMDELRRAHTNLCSVTASMEQQKLAVNQKASDGSSRLDCSFGVVDLVFHDDTKGMHKVYLLSNLSRDPRGLC